MFCVNEILGQSKYPKILRKLGPEMGYNESSKILIIDLVKDDLAQKYRPIEVKKKNVEIMNKYAYIVDKHSILYYHSYHN